MADQKLADLTALTVTASGDLVYIEDVSEALPVDQAKRITVGDLLKAFFSDLTADIASGPAILNEAASGINPTLIPRKTDLLTGVGSGGIGNVSLIANGTEVFDILSIDTVFNGVRLRGGVTNSFQLANSGASATVPTLIHNRSSPTTGIGGSAAQISHIINSVEAMRIDASLTARDTRFLIYDVDNGQIERVTVGDADSGGTNFKVLRIPN